MIIAFYKVGNSQKYERHTFDDISDKPEEIMAKLKRLKSDEVRMYSTEAYGYGQTRPYPNMADFEDDYNDEIIDGSGWWCIVIREKKEG